MSCYEWEAGTIRLPSRIYSSFKKELWEFIKKQQERQFQVALEIYNKLMAAGKGKRNFNYHEALAKLWPRPNTFEPTPQRVDHDEIYFIVLPSMEKKLRRPQKKFFKVPKLKDLHMQCDDGSIQFCDDCKTVEWYVSENNHACENARAHFVARQFFQQLGRVKWTRGSGGQIVGNDEYNQDSYDVGGGGNYLVRAYGPKTARGARDGRFAAARL